MGCTGNFLGNLKSNMDRFIADKLLEDDVITFI